MRSIILIALLMIVLGLISPEMAKANTFRPVDLVCPKNANGKSGKIVFLSESESLTFQRLTVTYKNGAQVHGVFEGTAPSAPNDFVTLYDGDLPNYSTDLDRSATRLFKNAVGPVFDQGCNGSLQEQDRYRALLRANKCTVDPKSSNCRQN